MPNVLDQNEYEVNMNEQGMYELSLEPLEHINRM